MRTGSCSTLLLALAIPLSVAAKLPDTTVERALDELGSLDRRITVLMEAGTLSNERTGTAWALQARKVEVIDTITHSAREQLEAKRPLPAKTPDVVRTFVSYMRARPGGLGVGDLVYDEVADRIEAAIDEVPTLPAEDRDWYRHELAALRADLDRVRREYGAEVASPRDPAAQTPQLERPRWKTYVEELEKKTPLDQLLRDPVHRDDASSLSHAFAQRDQGTVVDGTLKAREVVLTFDDGPSARHTPTVLDTLATHGAPATFFQVGSNVGVLQGKAPVVGAHAAIERRILAAGHTLANHSYSHPLLTKLGSERITTELASTGALLAVFTERVPPLFRPPYGGLNATVRDVVRREGLTIVLWSVDSQDWRDHIPESIAQRTLGQLRGNGRGIVLLHDIHLQTVRALPLIMQGLQREGFRTVPLATALP